MAINLSDKKASLCLVTGIKMHLLSKLWLRDKRTHLQIRVEGQVNSSDKQASVGRQVNASAKQALDARKMSSSAKQAWVWGQVNKTDTQASECMNKKTFFLLFRSRKYSGIQSLFRKHCIKTPLIHYSTD